MPLPSGQRDIEPPFVGPAAGGKEPVLPAAPPRRHPPGDGFDDEDGGAARARVEQPRQPAAPEVVGQLVDGVGREDAEAGAGLEAHAREVLTVGAALEAEDPIGPVRFGDRPGMPVEAGDAASRTLERPRGAGGAGPAAQIQHFSNRRRRSAAR